ncbi:hypothetical protein FP744_10003253 [Trichoderma asperellum]|nr:hypothetical protein LI328DRAFT_171062 [Trichoderma asperelloides]
MSPSLSISTFQALQAIDKLQGSEDWPSWQLLVRASASALRLSAHLDGSAQHKSPLLPRAREAHAQAESCARILILGSISPELRSRLCELSLRDYDESPAVDLMSWLYATVSSREATEMAYDDLAKPMRIHRKDFPSMDAYGKEALNLWSRVRHYWPASANVIAATSILEGMKQYNEHAYLGWKYLIVSRKGKIPQEDVFDIVAALRDCNDVENPMEVYRVADTNTTEEDSMYSRSSVKG